MVRYWWPRARGIRVGEEEDVVVKVVLVEEELPDIAEVGERSDRRLV